MSGFDGLPDVHWREDGRLVLDVALVYESESGQRYIVPSGFDTDLASIPKAIPGFVRMLMGDRIESAAAAILHDKLYRTHEVSRRVADALFFEALRSTGESREGAWMYWLGVRAGGWLAWWRSYRPEWAAS